MPSTVNAWLWFVFGAVCVGWTGCAHAPAAPMSCSGVIVRVERRPWDHYTLYRGSTPLTCITVAVTPRPSDREVRLVRVLFLEPGAEALRGRVGDTVVLRGARSILRRGTVWADQLEDYAVQRRRPNPLL